ncbi:MAG: hypothetical protein ACRECP_02370, partial [Methylocella sp.]
MITFINATKRCIVGPAKARKLSRSGVRRFFSEIRFASSACRLWARMRLTPLDLVILAAQLIPNPWEFDSRGDSRIGLGLIQHGQQGGLACRLRFRFVLTFM